MKTVKRLGIKDKPGEFFNNMTNITDIDGKLTLINEFTILKMDQLYLILVIAKKIIHYMLFLIM